MNSQRTILHITKRIIWQEACASGVYQTPSLKSDGFIHCSTVEQVLGPANELYHGQQDLVLLVISPQKLAARVVYEDCYDSGQAFPHIYGPLNVDAVEKVVDFPAADDGSFSLPPELDE